MARTAKGISVCLLAAMILWFVPWRAGAERTRFWKQSNYEEFEKGTAKGVALRSDGRLVLAPRMAQFSDPNAAYLWALRMDSKGNLYAAGGSNAKVFRFDDKGVSTAVFDSQEMAVQALAIDAQDNLYIGTSPDGKVYRLTAKGERSIFFEPKTKYIWDLAVDASGVVYVATGDKGEVFAVTSDGKSEVFYRGSETHIRALAFDTKGNLIIGTEPSGLIIRVEKTGAATKERSSERPGFVIYETDRKEITSLVVDSAGNIYAASVGDKPRVLPGIVSPLPPTQQTTITATGQTVVTTAPAPQQPAQFAPFPQLTGGSGVYRISADGAPEELWSSREDLVYSIGLSPAGKLLLGTGNRGLVIQLEGSRVHSALPKTASAQVTGFLRNASGKIFFTTANPGKVFALGPDSEPEGSFESQTFDAKVFSQWGRLSWWGEDGAADGGVSFYVRTGNTSNPEKNWSPWAGPFASAKGEAVNCPAARFAQWKVVFKGGPGLRKENAATNISWVSLAYLPKNVAPTVDSIVVQNPNVRVQGFAAQQQQQQAAQLKMPPTPGALISTAVSQPSQQPSRFEPPPQGTIQRGFQSVLWGARDDNDDELEYCIFYRGEEERNWKLLKDKIEHKYFSWESGSLPDGAYYLKIVASDASSNPPDQALSGERESDRFEVDNTPPVVENLKADAASSSVRVKFDARDSFSPIAKAEYSLNAGDWLQMFPLDRVTDSPLESFEIVLSNLPAGEHTVAVRVADQFENAVSAKVTFLVPAAKKP